MCFEVVVAGVIDCDGRCCLLHALEPFVTMLNLGCLVAVTLGDIRAVI